MHQRALVLTRHRYSATSLLSSLTAVKSRRRRRYLEAMTTITIQDFDEIVGLKLR